MTTTINTTGEAMDTFDINTFDIVPICRGNWWERMTLRAYMKRAYLDAYETKGVHDRLLTPEDFVWASVFEKDGIEYVQGLSFRTPSLDDDLDY
jgi:hypothetical protein